MRQALAAVWLLACPVRAQQPREKGWQWHETTSPHFAVAHEMPWAPPGFVMNLERMHSRLRMDLGMFSPWMAKERIKLYLYKDSKSYLAGEFSPPPWSNGVAIFDLKAVAVPDNPDRNVLMRVIGHETTHLLFQGYWHEAGKEPPSWLNEGLAMMEEIDSKEHPEKSPWFQSMVLSRPGALLPMKQFFSINPTKDLQNKEVVGDWYVQAYSVTFFLYRAHQRLQFKTFCGQLLEGRTLEESLWLSYRYRGFAALEKDWRRWVNQSEFKTRVMAALAASPPELPAAAGKPKEAFTPSSSKFSPMKGFKSLRE